MVNVSQQSSNPAEIEDPSSEKMVEARRATFMSSWPHEGKRGWVCKTEKVIIEFYALLSQYSELTCFSCSWWKLDGISAQTKKAKTSSVVLIVSFRWMDGNQKIIHSEFQLLLPFLASISPIPSDEHYRRSSDCSFFAFAAAPGKKSTRQSRAKKPRASKTSRASTQSNATTVSEAGTVDVDDDMDQSTISQATTKSKTTKKTTKAKAKVGRPKKEETAEPADEMDIDDNNNGSDAKPRSKRTGRGKKRASDEMDGDEQLQDENNGDVKPERPTKKRTTKTRNTAQESIDSDADTNTRSLENTLPEDSMPKKGPSKPRGGKKKQSSLSTRKPSADSTASKASLRSRVPDDAEIEAELEAGLDDAMSEDEIDAIPQGNQGLSQGLNQSEPSDTGYQVSSASVAPVRAPKRSKTDSLANETIERHQSISEDEFEDTQPKAGRKVPAKRKVATKNSSHSEDIPNQNLERSMVSVEIRVDDSGNEADAGTSNKPAKKGGKKKGPGRKAKKPTTEQSTAKQTKRLPLMEVSEHSDPEYDETNKKQTKGNRTASKPTEVEIEDDDRQKNIAERQPTPGIDGIPQASQKHKDGNSNAPLRDSSHASRKQQHTVQRSEPSVINISSPAQPTPMQKHTPSPSPQSSDAENQPPSTRPSANRPPVLSPSKKVNITVPLAASTPSASPSKRNTGRALNTTYPWLSTDIDEVLLAGSLDKENVDLNSALNEAKGGLDSPQKKMTVEEWLVWNSTNGEEKLKRECERLVGIFEKEGGRAMMALEGIECVE